MKKLLKPGRYTLQKRAPEGGILAKRISENVWKLWAANAGWDTVEEARRMQTTLQKRHTHYEFRILDQHTNEEIK